MPIMVAAAPSSVTTMAAGTAKVDCTPARPAPAARSSYTFRGRNYRLALPRDYDGVHAEPMVLLFHGFASSKEAIDADRACAPRRSLPFSACVAA